MADFFQPEFALDSAASYVRYDCPRPCMEHEEAGREMAEDTGTWQYRAERVTQRSADCACARCTASGCVEVLLQDTSHVITLDITRFSRYLHNRMQ